MINNMNWQHAVCTVVWNSLPEYLTFGTRVPRCVCYFFIRLSLSESYHVEGLLLNFHLYCYWIFVFRHAMVRCTVFITMRHLPWRDCNSALGTSTKLNADERSCYLSSWDSTAPWWVLAADQSCSTTTVFTHGRRTPSKMLCTRCRCSAADHVRVFWGSSSHRTRVLRGQCPTSASSSSSISDSFVLSGIHSTATPLQHSFMRSLSRVAIAVTLCSRGRPRPPMTRLQRVLNAAARVGQRHPRIRFGSVTNCIGWLCCMERVTYKLTLMVYHCLYATAPRYLSEMC